MIFVPGSAVRLTPFVGTLLKWTDCRLRLVANGLDDEEIAVVRSFAERNDRADVLVLSDGSVVPHGEALNELSNSCTSTHFCLIDPDVFAVGPFLDELLPHLSRAEVVFGATPVYARNSDLVMRRARQFLSGTEVITRDGVVLGCTWFAIYDADAVRRVRCETGVGFQVYDWSDIQPPIRRTIAALGLKRARFDTGKVLNIVLASTGARLRFTDTPMLRHVGGLSSLHVPAEDGLAPIGERWSRRIRSRFHPLEHRRRRHLMKRKHVTTQYVDGLVTSREFEPTLPQARVIDSALRERLLHLDREIRDILAEDSRREVRPPVT